MIAGLAVALPILLGLMGVAVTLIPPPETGMIRWVWMAAFAIIGIAAFSVGVADRHSSDGEQDALRREIKGLTEAVKALTKPVETPSPGRDPDTIYQNGMPAGKIKSARITLNDSKIYFDQLENAGSLDRAKTFEYRDFRLRFIRADSYIGMLVTSDGVANNVYQHVVSEIVGRVQ